MGEEGQFVEFVLGVICLEQLLEIFVPPVVTIPWRLVISRLQDMGW